MSEMSQQDRVIANTLRALHYLEERHRELVAEVNNCRRAMRFLWEQFDKRMADRESDRIDVALGQAFGPDGAEQVFADESAEAREFGSHMERWLDAERVQPGSGGPILPNED